MKKQLFHDSCGAVRFTKLPETKLTEAKGAVGVWEAPIWQLGKLNLNGRVYTKDLAERIVAEARALPSYDGHEGDRFGDYSPIKAICKNPRIEGPDGRQLLVVEIFIIDESYEKQLEKVVDFGLGIGVSSVGYGETDQDGVVNPHTYELVRYLDFVTTPAGEVYATPKQDQAGESNESNGLPLPESGEVSTGNLQKVERYKRVQAHVLARRSKC